MAKVDATTAARAAKAAGLKRLNEVEELTQQSRQTLQNWCNDKPALFKVVIVGCAALKDNEIKIVGTTAATAAKAAGLKGLNDAIELTQQSRQNLQNWFKDKPALFKVVIAGCAALKNSEAAGNNNL